MWVDIQITCFDSRRFFKVGSEQIEISDYKFQSSSDGAAEICITIRSNLPKFELSASLIGQTQPSL